MLGLGIEGLLEDWIMFAAACVVRTRSDKGRLTE